VVIPTNSSSVSYLTNFMDADSQIGAIELWKLVFSVYILHLELSFSTIRPHTAQSHNRASACDEFVYPTLLSILNRVFKYWRVEAFSGSENLKAFIAHVHPRYLPPFPVDINYALKSHNWPNRFENIVFNKRKARGHIPLK